MGSNIASLHLITHNQEISGIVLLVQAVRKFLPGEIEHHRAIFYTPLRVRSSSASASAIADIAEEYTDDLKGIKLRSIHLPVGHL